MKKILSRTLKTVVDTFPNTSKFVKEILQSIIFSTLFSVLENVIKHGLSYVIYFWHNTSYSMKILTRILDENCISGVRDRDLNK